MAHATTSELLGLGRGEREAIALARELRADRLLVDDRLARQAAIQAGLRVAGTLSVIQEAADRGLLDLRTTLTELRATTFHIADAVIDQILRRSDTK